MRLCDHASIVLVTVDWTVAWRLLTANPPAIAEDLTNRPRRFYKYSHVKKNFLKLKKISQTDLQAS